MEILMMIIAAIVAILIVCGLIKNANSNPAYEAWLTQDKAEYPELYDE